MESMDFDGSTWWRITPLAEFPKPKYGKLPFNPVFFGMSISLWTLAIWLAFDVLFQIHVTFKRWRGLYYWAVLCTTIGVANHAGMLIVKCTTELSVAEDIGTTVLVKLGDVMTQTGFSLVLYSRLNLVVRTWKPSSLKWVLIAILVSSFLVHTPVIVCTFGLNVPSPARVKWLERALITEKIIILWFTLQELTLLSFYTWTTARLVGSRPVEPSNTLLKHRSTQTRRRLFLIMLIAQALTFLTDITLVILTFVGLNNWKGIFHPFFYGVKLKVEFMVLNQLQRLVRPPNVSMYDHSDDLNPSNPPHQHSGNDRTTERTNEEYQNSVLEKNGSLYPSYGAPSSDPPISGTKESGLAVTSEQSNAQVDQNLSQGPTTQSYRVASSIDESVTAFERQ